MDLYHFDLIFSILSASAIFISEPSLFSSHIMGRLPVLLSVVQKKYKAIHICNLKISSSHSKEDKKKQVKLISLMYL